MPEKNINNHSQDALFRKNKGKKLLKDFLLFHTSWHNLKWKMKF